MNTSTRPITPSELPELLLRLASEARRPVMLWGAPGIGKSSLVEQFAEEMGMDCVTLLGTQLAPEDLIGVPQITEEGYSRFCPPETIAREDAYVLFLDELNGSSHEIQKAFYSLIHDRRLGNYSLHPDSIVVAAGNRSQDSAIVKPLSSALINRMIHIHLQVSAADWLEWASANDVHPLVWEYIKARPDQLWSPPPKHEAPFSSPRSWHMLSDALQTYGDPIPEDAVRVLADGLLTAEHSMRFQAAVKTKSSPHLLEKIIKGDKSWPSDAKDADVLYDLTLSFHQRLIKEMPQDRSQAPEGLRHSSKQLIKRLYDIRADYAKLLLTADEQGQELPDWFVAELARDLPRLLQND